MKSSSALTAISLCALFAAGCITHKETVYRDVPRAKVEFENEKAGRTFYEALSKMPRKNRSESHTKFSIPVVLDHSETVVTGDNEIFNDAVHRCDTNQDGKITGQEADIFAAQFK